MRTNTSIISRGWMTLLARYISTFIRQQLLQISLSSPWNRLLKPFLTRGKRQKKERKVIAPLWLHLQQENLHKRNSDIIRKQLINLNYEKRTQFKKKNYHWLGLKRKTTPSRTEQPIYNFNTQHPPMQPEHGVQSELFFSFWTLHWHMGADGLI